MARLRMPDNRRLFGANIVPTAADVAPAAGQQAWINMFLNWDWDGWVKPQVDYLCGNGIGANCLRMIGSQEGVITGRFSQDYHDSRLEQLITYCRSLGVHYFLCTGGVQQPLVDTLAAGWLTPQLLARVQATTINRVGVYDNVIGCDLLQEAQGGTFGNSFLIPMVSEVRRLTNNLLPLTCSASMVNTSAGVPIPGPTGENWLLNAGDGRMAQYFDFISGHLYFRALDNTWFDQFTSAFPNHDILIGEFGQNLGGGVTAQVNDYSRYLSMGNAPIRQVRGALCWAASDQSVSAAEQWGVYSATFAARPWMLDVLRQYTLGSVVKGNTARR